MDGTEQDERLVQRLADGDVAALDALYQRHAGVVFALQVRIVGDREVAEELLQEAFLRAWQHAAAYDGRRGQARSWLLGIAHHLALNELRRRRRRPQDEPESRRWEDDRGGADPTDPAPAPFELAWAALRQEEVVRALGELPPASRRVIELYTVGYTQAEIADRLGEPLGTVKTRMRRGLQQMRGVLRGLGEDD